MDSVQDMQIFTMTWDLQELIMRIEALRQQLTYRKATEAEQKFMDNIAGWASMCVASKILPSPAITPEPVVWALN